VVASSKQEQDLEGVRHRFEWDAENFAAIYRLERSPLSRAFNRVFRKAVFQRYELTFREAGDVTGKSALDIGCGSGIYSVDFARRGARRVLGVDFSTNMLRLAREEARQRAVTEACEFREGNFLEIEIDEKFDVVFAMGVFDYLPEPAPFLRKMVAVSKGKTIASFPGHSLLREPARRLRYRLTRRGDVHFYSDNDVRQLAEKVGFADYKIIPIPSSGGGFLLVGTSVLEQTTAETRQSRD
jgi:2-polyprenyl-3-methyl-5-hydroxy-6-metoxy-1,4-benzoquinol methylase